MDLAKIVRIVIALVIIIGLVAGVAALATSFAQAGDSARSLFAGNYQFTRGGFLTHDFLEPLGMVRAVLTSLGLDLSVFSLIGSSLIIVAMLMIGWQLFLRVFGQ